MRILAEDGLDSFYRGRLARRNAAGLEAVGSPVRLDDLAAYRARVRTPLVLEHSLGALYNVPPPTQGLVSLIILGLLDRLNVGRCEPDSAEYGVVQIRVTRETWIPLVGAALATFGVTHKPPVLNHARLSSTARSLGQSCGRVCAGLGR